MYLRVSEGLGDVYLGPPYDRSKAVKANRQYGSALGWKNHLKRLQSKKEGRNRRVEVFGVKEEPSTPVKPAPPPAKSPKVPNVRDIPETTKEWIKEKDRQTLEQKRYDAIPGLPPGMSIRDWVEKLLSRLPKWWRTKIADAVVSGACAALATLMEQAGVSNAEKEALKAACKASAQTKSR